MPAITILRVPCPFYPDRSKIVWVLMFDNNSSCRDPLTGNITTDAFATVSLPPFTFRFDTFGSSVPAGQTFRNPRPDVPVTVRFNETAVAA